MNLRKKPSLDSSRIFVFGDTKRRESDIIPILNSLGYTVHQGEAPGKTDLKAARNANPDLVMVELAAEHMTEGFALSDRARAQLACPVIFLCGAGAGDDIPEEKLSLPHGYLERPFSETDVQRLVEITLYTVRLENSRRAAETARQEAESHYHLLADNLEDVIFKLDVNLNYTYISPSVKRMRGYAAEEVIGRSFREMATPDSVEKAEAMVAREMDLARSGRAAPSRTHSIEAEVYCKDGSTRWTEAKFSFIRDDNNLPVVVIGVNRDITDRKQIVSRLMESEEKFRTLAEACPFAIMIYQNDFWVYANPAAEAISGYSADELYQLRFWEIVHPDYQSLVRNRGSKRQTGKQAPPAYDFKIIHKSGNDIWVSLSGSSLMYQGRPAGLITVIDITERKLAEEALRKSEEKYRTVLESIEDGYYEVDLAGNFTFFNDFACRISGRRPEEVMGVNYREYTDAENAKRLFQTFHQVYLTGIPTKAFDLEIIPKTGDRRNVEISASLIRNEASEPEGFRGIIRDITERKEAEAHQARLEAQLQQAQKMEAIGTLAGGVAHDFNNILQAINGYTQLLLMQKTPDDPDYSKLTQLQKSGERAANLVEQLLTFSRKMEGQRRQISLNHEIQVVDKLLKQTTPKMIERRLDLDDALWPVYADPVHMEQILLNLGSNAADAMPEGGTLTFETRNVVLDADSDELPGAAPGPYVRLTVSDTGCGMDAETVHQIFDPFFTTKEVGKGTGLGLASVYGIVKSHGGQILCNSRVNQGTAFKIYLPAASETMPETETVQQSAMPEGGQETLLVVDDELPVREAATEILQHFGYQILCAENAEQAIDIYRQNLNEVALVILDLSMPGMGGNQCLRELLALNSTAKVIISSGYAADGLAKEALTSGASGFIGKPYQAADIARKVRTILDQDSNPHS